jgi:hypothetical protein
LKSEDEDERMDGGDEGGDQGASDDDDDDADEDGGGDAEPVALHGVAAALRLFKSRGILKEGGGGRGGGTAAEHYGAEKYDAFGHEQSMKEQFRYISHKFHGIEPGLKKQEKRLNRVQVEAQRLQAIREQGGAVEKIAEKQRAAGSAHVVMDKKLGAELANTGAAKAAAGGAASGEHRGKKRKESGPFAQFGFGKGGFQKKRKAQEADAAKKAATAAAAQGGGM